MTTMSFLEHLEELRRRLIVCVVAVIICMAISWPLVPTVQQFITRPLQEPSVTQKWSYILESWATQKFPDLAHRVGLKPEPPQVNPHRLNYMAPLEPFFVQMKITMITGLAHGAAEIHPVCTIEEALAQGIRVRFVPDMPGADTVDGMAAIRVFRDLHASTPRGRRCPTSSGRPGSGTASSGES